MSGEYYTWEENDEFVFLKIRDCKVIMLQREMWPMIQSGLNDLKKDNLAPNLKVRFYFAAKIIFNKFRALLKRTRLGIKSIFVNFLNDLTLPHPQNNRALSGKEMTLLTKVFGYFDKLPAKDEGV